MSVLAHCYHIKTVRKYMFLVFFKKKIIWRIIVLQNFVVFCHISTRISHRYTHVSSLPDLPAISLPNPLQPAAEPLFEFPESHSKFPMAICFTRGIVNFYVTLSLHLPISFLSFHLVHRSILHVCFPIAALKINSSVLSLSDSLNMCQYTKLLFLFLTYLTLYNGL